MLTQQIEVQLKSRHFTGDISKFSYEIFHKTLNFFKKKLSNQFSEQDPKKRRSQE